MATMPRVSMLLRLGWTNSQCWFSHISSETLGLPVPPSASTIPTRHHLRRPPGKEGRGKAARGRFPLRRLSGEDGFIQTRACFSRVPAPSPPTHESLSAVSPPQFPCSDTL